MTRCRQVAALNPEHEHGGLLAVYYAPWCPYSRRYWKTVVQVATRFPTLRAVALDVSLSPGCTSHRSGLPLSSTS